MESQQRLEVSSFHEPWLLHQKLQHGPQTKIDCLTLVRCLALRHFVALSCGDRAYNRDHFGNIDKFRCRLLNLLHTLPKQRVEDGCFNIFNGGRTCHFHALAFAPGCRTTFDASSPLTVLSMLFNHSSMRTTLSTGSPSRLETNRSASLRITLSFSKDAPATIASTTSAQGVERLALLCGPCMALIYP